MRKRAAFLLVLFAFLIPLQARPKVALVLSGGGARGYAEIPVIEELDRRGIYPDIVVGTSMGGLLASLYASGYSGSDIREFVEKEDITGAVFSLHGSDADPYVTPVAYDKYSGGLELSFSKSGVGSENSLLADSSVNRLIRKATLRVANVSDYSTLSSLLAVNTTDFRTGDNVVVDSGPIYLAMRGTMSVPIAFPPMLLDDGKVIVDGGLTDNFPVALAQKLGADIIIGVDVNEDVRVHGAETDALTTLSGVVIQFVVIPGQVTARKQYGDVDYLLIPKTGEYSFAAFPSRDELIKIGEEAVEENIALFDELEESLKEYLPFEGRMSYFDREYPTIEGISMPDGMEKYEKRFSKFVGKAYDEETLDRIESELNTIKAYANLKSFDYVMRDGVLVFTAIPYGRMDSSISLGVKGKVLSESFQSMKSDLALTLTSLFDVGPVNLGLDLRFSESLSLRGSVRKEIISGKGDIGLSLEAGYGNYSSLADRLRKHIFRTEDAMSSASADILFRPFKFTSLDFYSTVSWYGLGNDKKATGGSERIWDDHEFLISVFGISAKHDTFRKNSSFPFSAALEGKVELVLKEKDDMRLHGEFDAKLAYSPFRHGSVLFLTSFFYSGYPESLMQSVKTTIFGDSHHELASFSLGYMHEFTQGGKAKASILPFVYSELDFSSVSYGVALSLSYDFSMVEVVGFFAVDDEGNFSVGASIK